MLLMNKSDLNHRDTSMLIALDLSAHLASLITLGISYIHKSLAIW